MKIKNKKLTEDEFFKTRKEVLSGWPTGKDIDLKECAEYIKKLPENKNVCCVLRKAKKEEVTLAQPRAGVALLESHIELLKYLQDEGGADMLPSTIDSYTRQNRYDQCEIEIEESKKAGRSMLNGFPAVNYGKDGCRKVIESVNVPVQARHGTPDSRLLAEIIHAGGWTSNEGGGISYNIPYAKNVSVGKSLIDWQYCDRLVGMYEEMGAHINREPFGPLTGTLVPPSMSNAVSIIEGLLAAEQGVRNITLGYGQCGYIVQDVAAMKALYDDAKEYFKKYGYDVELTTVFHEWMGGFPEDESKAFGLISLGAAAAALSGATKVIVKTPHEAYGIPTKEANAAGIKATKEVLNLLKGQRFPDCRELRDEIEIIKSETQCILNKVYELGDGDIAVGTVKAFETGVIDVPFAPSKYNLGLILPARDNKGSVRYLDFGNLPFTDDIKDFNRKLLSERGKYEKRSVDFKMTVDDVYAVSRGFLVGRPGIEHLK